MTARSFRDTAGVEWVVWAVHPQFSERRSRVERRSGRDRRVDPARPGAGGRPDRRALTDRRVTRRPSVFLPGYEQGWLCFEGGADRRRLAPIPAGWEDCDAAALEAYCRRAVRSAPASRSA